MLLGMAQGQAEAVRRTVGSLLLYTPVVHPGEFDVAIAYLIRRLEEGASQENFMSAVFSLASSPALFAREEARFRDSLAPLSQPGGLDAPAPHRVGDRYAAVERPRPGHFENTPDSDPSVATVREWGAAITSRVATSTLGERAVQEARLTSAEQLETVLGRVRAAGTEWGSWSGAARAGAVLHAVGDALEANRAALVEVMAAEAGKTIDQADVEVSEAIDFAHFYGELAAQLDDVDGASFSPAALTLVTPPWNFPVAIPAGSTWPPSLPARPSCCSPRRRPSAAVPCWRRSSRPRSTPTASRRRARLRPGGRGRPLGKQLVAAPQVDRVILTGAYVDGRVVRSFVRTCRSSRRRRAKNAIIVTPSCDLDLAVKDVCRLRLGHADEMCSAASLVVLVGSVASSRRFRTQLLDAVSSLTSRVPDRRRRRWGRSSSPRRRQVLEGLTTLGSGSRGRSAPKRLDDTGKLWCPVSDDGVRRGRRSTAPSTFCPILGIMTAKTLDEAIDIVNEVDYA